jgi:hypothetical protein
VSGARGRDLEGASSLAGKKLSHTLPKAQGIHVVIGGRREKSWACGVFETRRRALAYIRKFPQKQRAALYVRSMPDLALPVYIIHSRHGLLFARWAKVTRYVKPGVTIYQAIDAFRSDKPGVDDMRQLLGLADIDRTTLKMVPDLMRFWKDQEEGYAWLDRNLDRAQRRRYEARKRRAIRVGLQQIREGKGIPEEEVDAALEAIIRKRWGDQGE